VALLYFFSAVTAFFVEGHVQRLLSRRKMSKAIKHLSGPTIVCGGGRTGQHIVQELLATERPFVLVAWTRARGRAHAAAGLRVSGRDRRRPGRRHTPRGRHRARGRSRRVHQQRQGQPDRHGLRAAAAARPPDRLPVHRREDRGEDPQGRRRLRRLAQPDRRPAHDFGGGEADGRLVPRHHAPRSAFEAPRRIHAGSAAIPARGLDRGRPSSWATSSSTGWRAAKSGPSSRAGASVLPGRCGSQPG
jgi:hypothetical protein